jgi:recombination DNA repair RAD52 pathway protein
MKKILSVTVLVMALAMLVACGGGNTPSSVVEKSMKCLQDKDYEGYVDLLYIDVKEGEDPEVQRNAVASMIASKADQTLAKKQGIKSYEILSEEVTPAEENKPETAVVKVKIEYGDASTKEETVKLKKDDAGDWKIDMGK